MADEKSRLVYSTDGAVPHKGKEPGKSGPPDVPRAQQKLRVRIERKGRGGKTVTVIEGLCMPDADREVLLKELRATLGTGGKDRDTSLEVQGDHREAVLAILERQGYKPKRSGG